MLLRFCTAIKSHYIKFFVTIVDMPRITARQKKAVRKPTAEFREETTSFCRPGIATLCHDCDFLVKSLLCEKYYRMRLVDKHAEGLGTANSELRHCPAKGPLPPIHHGPRTEPQAPRTYAPPPLTQIDPDPSTFPSNPVRRPRGGSREA